MQLEKISGKLGIATCTLLQVSASASHAEEWDIDTSFLYYSESDGRISAFEPAIRATIDLEDDESISFQAVVDALTGSTPNGAHKSTVAQTFTNPSGNQSYTVQAGDLPLSDTFRDVRVALSAEWDKPIDRLSSVLMAATISSEIDYTSIGLSSTYKYDMNNKNTTLEAGIAGTFDTINPIGDIPLGLNPMRVGKTDQQRDGVDDTKSSYDLMVGVTQIIDRKTLVQFNYTHGTVSGYQNDYNNVLTVIDPLTNQPLTNLWAAPGTNNLPYLFEKRPDSRSKDIFFVRGVRHLTEDVINTSYRFFTDDWGITSHTLDFKYRYELKGRHYLQPHLRYYSQTAADFYRHNLVQGVDVDVNGIAGTEFASHDYRLAEFDATTIGLKYGLPIGKSSEFAVRGEFMSQSISEATPAGEETPGLNAVILQMNYSFLW